VRKDIVGTGRQVVGMRFYSADRQQQYWPVRKESDYLLVVQALNGDP
jgi:hypothetical protein